MYMNERGEFEIMKKSIVFIVLFVLSVSMFFAVESIEGFTLSGGKVILNDDGTWEWVVKPDRYKDFNIVSPVYKPKVRVWSFKYETFFRDPYGCTGKQYRIYGMVDLVIKDGNGYFVKIYTNKDKYVWNDEVFLVNYSDFNLHVGDLVEFTAEFNSLSIQTKPNGDKYEVPLFVWTGDSTIYLK